MKEIGSLLILGFLILYGLFLRRIERHYSNPADIEKQYRKFRVYIAPTLILLAFFSVIILALYGVFAWIWVALGCLIAGLISLRWSYSSANQGQAPRVRIKALVILIPISILITTIFIILSFFGVR
jgi:hypothetical protein